VGGGASARVDSCDIKGLYIKGMYIKGMYIKGMYPYLTGDLQATPAWM
jgi:hypothetical protein